MKFDSNTPPPGLGLESLSTENPGKKKEEERLGEKSQSEELELQQASEKIEKLSQKIFTREDVSEILDQLERSPAFWNLLTTNEDLAHDFSVLHGINEEVKYQIKMASPQSGLIFTSPEDLKAYFIEFHKLKEELESLKKKYGENELTREERILKKKNLLCLLKQDEKRNRKIITEIKSEIRHLNLEEKTITLYIELKTQITNFQNTNNSFIRAKGFYLSTKRRISSKSPHLSDEELDKLVKDSKDWKETIQLMDEYFFTNMELPLSSTRNEQLKKVKKTLIEHVFKDEYLILKTTSFNEIPLNEFLNEFQEVKQLANDTRQAINSSFNGLKYEDIALLGFEKEISSAHKCSIDLDKLSTTLQIKLLESPAEKRPRKLEVYIYAAKLCLKEGEMDAAHTLITTITSVIDQVNISGIPKLGCLKDYELIQQLMKDQQAVLEYSMSRGYEPPLSTIRYFIEKLNKRAESAGDGEISTLVEKAKYAKAYKAGRQSEGKKKSPQNSTSCKIKEALTISEKITLKAYWINNPGKQHLFDETKEGNVALTRTNYLSVIRAKAKKELV